MESTFGLDMQIWPQILATDAAFQTLQDTIRGEYIAGAI